MEVMEVDVGFQHTINESRLAYCFFRMDYV